MKFHSALFLSFCSFASAGFLFNNPVTRFAHDMVTGFRHKFSPNMQLDYEFTNFTRKFRKHELPTYKNATELLKAREFFETSWRRVNRHNRKFMAGLVTYRQTIYEFDDEDPAVTIRQLTGTEKPRLLKMRTLKRTKSDKPTFPVGPPSKDWRHVLLPVKNQRSCGSCWAFSTTSQVEARLRMKNPKYNVPLSPQALIDCSRRGNHGCNGGWPKNALDYIIKSSTSSEANYGYVNHQNICRRAAKIEKPITNAFEFELDGDEEQLKNIVASEGPVIVGVYITRNFMNYDSGIFEDRNCARQAPSCMVSHAMVVVGYGTDPILRKDFWLVLNSWGADWGEAGFIRMARNTRNNCNVACYATYGK